MTAELKAEARKKFGIAGLVALALIPNVQNIVTRFVDKGFNGPSQEDVQMGDAATASKLLSIMELQHEPMRGAIDEHEESEVETEKWRREVMAELGELRGRIDR